MLTRTQIIIVVIVIIVFLVILVLGIYSSVATPVTPSNPTLTSGRDNPGRPLQSPPKQNIHPVDPTRPPLRRPLEKYSPPLRYTIQGAQNPPENVGGLQDFDAAYLGVLNSRPRAFLNIDLEGEAHLSTQAGNAYKYSRGRLYRKHEEEGEKSTPYTISPGPSPGTVLVLDSYGNPLGDASGNGIVFEILRRGR